MEKAHTICLEMLDQRGYVVEDADPDRIIALKGIDEYMVVFFADTDKFNVQRISQYISILKSMDDYNHCIIVHRNTITPVAKKIVEEENKDIDGNGTREIKIELFNVDELQYNITKHYLVPKHEVMYKHNTPELAEFKKKYQADKFPVIMKNDPIVRFYNFEKGDIIKVTRKNGFVAYRIVK